MRPTTQPVRLGVIGCGYWGPNIVRNFAENGGAEVVAVADLRPERLEAIRSRVPAAYLTTNPSEVIADPTIEAVAITTPVSTHFELGLAALEVGKHVLMAKPLCQAVAEAEELLALARERNLVLLVDHTFVYTPVVRMIKRLLDDERLGKLWYFDSVRVNLGLFQHDVNVIWDLAAHDFAILLYLLDGQLPTVVHAVGGIHSRSSMHDVAYVSLEYADGLIAHFHLNWLSPVKIRQTLIGGSVRMLVWNDLDADEKLKVYNKGITVATDEASVHAQIVSYRTGDAWIPALDRREALSLEVEHFLDCIRHGSTPLTGGVVGRDVVRLLEASSTSLREDGRAVEVARLSDPRMV